MKRLLAVGILVKMAVLLVSAPLVAETILVSVPIPAGDGGNVCVCTNLKDSANFHFSIRNINGSTVCDDEFIPIGGVGRCATTWAGPLNCKVRRVDRKPMSSKKVKCTFFAVDTNGNPTDHVPVDSKINWPY